MEEPKQPNAKFDELLTKFFRLDAAVQRLIEHESIDRPKYEGWHEASWIVRVSFAEATGQLRSARLLVPILLVGVLLRHDTAQRLPGYTPAAWFYILGGAFEIVLCAAILRLAHSAYPLLTSVMWIGILEGAQASICRILTADISKVP